MGRKFLFTSITGFCFGIGTISASFHDGRRRDSLNEAFKMSNTGRVRRSAFSFRSQPRMPSGPVDFDGFRPGNFLKTDSSVTSYVLLWTGWMESPAVRGVNVHIGARKV